MDLAAVRFVGLELQPQSAFVLAGEQRVGLRDEPFAPHLLAGVAAHVVEQEAFDIGASDTGDGCRGADGLRCIADGALRVHVPVAPDLAGGRIDDVVEQPLPPGVPAGTRVFSHSQRPERMAVSA
ncbi:hypothetical protein CHX26_04720 [Porphyrobacter sp. HT-58-2]|nr:hypothetical protein CHX26_04720 [Porphyrobacter sp. HT-58-2]